MSDITDRPRTDVAQNSMSPPAERMWQPLAGLRDEMDRMLTGFWRSVMPTSSPEAQSAWPTGLGLGGALAAVDIAENDTAFRLNMELPGLCKDQVEIEVSGEVLTIKGEKREQREDKSATYTLSERRYGSFRRSFQLPAGIDRDSITASFDKGVLHVTLPKSPEAQRQSRRIEVRSAG